MTILDNHIRNEVPMAATIGFFDGVHRGHRYLIEQVKSEAEARGQRSLLITFGEHPLKVIRSDFYPQLICTTDEKLRLLSDTGVDALAVLDFDHKQSLMTARQFMADVLLDTYGVRTLIIGHDHHFGHDREKGFDDYARYGKELGIEVVLAQPFTSADSGTPSSTAIRQALVVGDLPLANTLLGYPFFLNGSVVSGFQNGRKLGFPTANINVTSEKILPKSGVYLVRVQDVDGTQMDGAEPRYGMLNIGTRPTLKNGDAESVEVHIFDFEGDIYAHTLNIEFIQFIRPERCFDNVDLLQAQLASDEQLCRELIRQSLCRQRV